MNASRVSPLLKAAIAFACLAPLLVRAEQRPFVVVPAADARNVRVEQSGDGRVTILYDLVASDAKTAVMVSLEAAPAQGEVFTIKPVATDGDVGSAVSPGTGKRIVWDAGKDVEDIQLDKFAYRVVATPAYDTVPELLRGYGTLTVISSPDGAQIAIDGKPIGLAPLAIRNLAQGRHRVTATLPGFSDANSQVLIADGEAARVELPLVRAASPGESQNARKGSGAKWIAIGGGAAAAAGIAVAAGGGGAAAAPPGTTTPTTTTTTTTTPTTTTATNRAPTVTCGNVVIVGLARPIAATDIVIASATRLQFSILAASDVDGDSLSFTVAYGNGVTATGTYSAVNNSTSYIYPGASVYSPSVTIRDARGGEAGCRFSTVTTSTIAGDWTGPPTAGRISSRFTLSQSGLNVSGNYFEGERTAASAVQGTLSSNVTGRKDGTISLTVGGNYGNQLTFLLEPADDLKSYRGTYTYRGTTAAFEMRK